jgi:hypothetical protein
VNPSCLMNAIEPLIEPERNQPAVHHARAVEFAACCERRAAG